MAARTIRFATQIKGGVDERWVQRPDHASRIEHFWWDPRGGWATTGGYGRTLQGQGAADPFSGFGIVHTLYWFSRHNGAQQFLLWEEANRLSAFNGSGYSYQTQIKTDRQTFTTPWQKTQYAAWGGWCYIINGMDEPIRYNGREAVRCGFDRTPPQPVARGSKEGFQKNTADDSRGVGKAGENASDVKSKYRYAMTYVNDIGVESPLSEPSNEVSWTIGRTTEDGLRRLISVDVPAGPAQTMARRLYRTMDYDGFPATDGLTYYLVKEFRNNIRCLWTDGIPDARLGASINRSDTGPWPAGAKYIAFFKGVMFLAGMTEYPDRVVYSRPSQHESFPPDNYFHIGDIDGGEITGMYATKNALVVFKRRGIYLIKSEAITGTGISIGFSAWTLTEDSGNHAPNCLREIPGLGLVYVDEKGVHVVIGALENEGTITGVRSISHPPEGTGGSIEDTWRDVNVHALMNACAAFYHKDRELWIAVPMYGSWKNNMVLVYHYETRTWSTRPNIPAGCITEARDHRGYLFFGSNTPASIKGVFAWSNGYADYQGTTVNHIFESAWLNFGRMYQNTSVASVIPLVAGMGHAISLEYFVDRHIDGERTGMGEALDSRDAQDPQRPYTEWDTGTWNDGLKVMQVRPVVVRFDTYSEQRCCQEFKFQLSTTGRMEIMGYDVEIFAGDRRDTKPLNTLISPEVP